MRAPEQDSDVIRFFLREYDKAIADERDAYERAASAADELQALGVDVEKIRPGP